MSELEQKVFDFVNKWKIVSKSMLVRQRFAEAEPEKVREAVDNLAAGAKIKKTTVVHDNEEEYLLLPANAYLRL